MHLTFKETKEEVYAAQIVSKHVSPHLHNALEIVCVTEGTLEMGVRLSYACTRLVNSGDTILDICLDSGFDSQRTFNRAFKERYRITPSEYRKLKR